MDYTVPVAKTFLQKQIIVPGSKSMTSRALLLAALAEGTSRISGILISEDTLTMIDALCALGIEIKLNKDERVCRVLGHRGQFPRKKASIWCADSGIAARFLLAACSISSGVYDFDGSEQLKKRPIAGLLQALSLLGVQISPVGAQQLPLTLVSNGQLPGGEVTVNAAVTGQFISALLIAAPFAKTPLSIKTKSIVSDPYIEMTRAMMSAFGVQTQRLQETHFWVPAPQFYRACDYVIEPDFSTASYFFAAAAVTAGTMAIQSCDTKKSNQGDVVFLQILKKMGCDIVEDDAGLTVKGTTALSGVEVNMRDCSDVFMTLAAIAPFAKTPTTITHIGHARHKESDRIFSMRTGLEKLKIKVEEGPDWLRIYPGTPRGAVIDSYQDHRIAMAFAVIGLRTPGLTIQGVECVRKTCPEFFKILFSTTMVAAV